jgi:hypothetical protein
LVASSQVIPGSRKPTRSHGPLSPSSRHIGGIPHGLQSEDSCAIPERHLLMASQPIVYRVISSLWQLGDHGGTIFTHQGLRGDEWAPLRILDQWASYFAAKSGLGSSPRRISLCVPVVRCPSANLRFHFALQAVAGFLAFSATPLFWDRWSHLLKHLRINGLQNYLHSVPTESGWYS